MRLHRITIKKGIKDILWVGGIWYQKIDNIFPMFSKKVKYDPIAHKLVRILMAEYSYECFKELRNKSIRIDTGENYVSIRHVREVLGLWANDEVTLQIKK